MEYAYYGLVVLTALFVSLFFYKKNKRDNAVYSTRDLDEDDSEDGSMDEDDKSETTVDSDENGFDYYRFDIIYYWVTQKVIRRNDIDYNILKEKIINTIGSLPEVLEDGTTFAQKDQTELLKEVLGRLEYSSWLKFFVINKGRKLSQSMKSLFTVIGFALFVFFQIEIRKQTDEFGFFYFVAAVISFILSFIFGKFSDKFLSALLKTLKPGDYIKLISAPDEIIEKKVKVNQLSNNETSFNKTTIFLSKKKFLCEELLSQSAQLPNTINNKLCLYIVIDYLKTVYSKEAYREYLLEKELDALEFVCGFKSDSVSANFELALLYFEAQRFDDFYDTLLRCRNINGYDCIIEAYIKSYEFYKAECGASS